MNVLKNMLNMAVKYMDLHNGKIKELPYSFTIYPENAPDHKIDFKLLGVTGTSMVRRNRRYIVAFIKANSDTYHLELAYAANGRVDFQDCENPLFEYEMKSLGSYYIMLTMVADMVEKSIRDGRYEIPYS